MHACGHDCHVAILMAAAEVLARHKAQLRGAVKLLFQPAEEKLPAWRDRRRAVDGGARGHGRARSRTRCSGCT